MIHKINKKGLSGVIVAVILVGFSIIIAGVVWAVIRGLVSEQLESTKPCFNTFGKVSINGLYTCYDQTNLRTHFSISIGDLDVEKVVVVMSNPGESKTFSITNNAQTIPNLANYGSTGFGTDSIILPGKNGGKTYITNGLTIIPNEIKLAPVIEGQQCEVSDAVYNIEECPQ